MGSVVLIPARYASKRLHAKLVLPEVKSVTGRYMIEHVYQNVKEAKKIDRVIVATDSKDIYDVVKGFGGEVEMTSTAHKSGTDRIAEVAARIEADIIVNVQGDEPEVNPAMVDQLIDTLREDKQAKMATLAHKMEDLVEITDPNVVKVVLDNSGYALYFSRAKIPYVRDEKDGDGNPHSIFLRHIGIYAYQREFLLRYSTLPASPLEHDEKLEQLRALSNGYKIKVALTHYLPIGIDTRDDLNLFMERYNYD
ncbi:MAG: 3-deoxy-manno-octulosonate cytidylyltransferase [Candidatus Brocadiaceae bacterium]|nr:3-deoxy-manno-octulosonate cytidylyltransferase [Candidatus Brocadiaceae bacterium]